MAFDDASDGAEYFEDYNQYKCYEESVTTIIEDPEETKTEGAKVEKM